MQRKIDERVLTDVKHIAVRRNYLAVCDHKENTDERCDENRGNAEKSIRNIGEIGEIYDEKI